MLLGLTGGTQWKNTDGNTFVIGDPELTGNRAEWVDAPTASWHVGGCKFGVSDCFHGSETKDREELFLLQPASLVLKLMLPWGRDSRMGVKNFAQPIDDGAWPKMASMALQLGSQTWRKEP